jgi:hypothetical protein
MCVRIQLAPFNSFGVSIVVLNYADITESQAQAGKWGVTQSICNPGER